jgi:DNA-binding NtrC family response regulator
VRLVERIAPAPMHVLVTGETGVGKDAIAALLHRRSGRARLVHVDCAGGSAEAIGEALFGADGAFAEPTGGKTTLVLDELSALSLDVQDALVRELDRDIGVRVIATTRRDLEAEIDEGLLRRELFHRLEGVAIEVPPLRRRPADIAPLALRFAAQAAASLGRAPPQLDGDALELLSGYVWPGNVRELRNVVRRAVVLCDGASIGRRQLPIEKLTAQFVAPKSDGRKPPELFEAVRRELAPLERQRIVDALERANGNQTEAARLLGISRRTLINRLELYGLPRPRKRGHKQSASSRP